MKNHSITRPFARGTAIGALVLSCFGALWAFAALGNWPQSPLWAYLAAAIVSVALVVSSAAGFVAAGRLPPSQADDPTHAEWRAARKWFGIICAVEGILIAAAVVGLGRAGQALLIPVAVAAIVGLHFLPLARVFHVPIYWATGLLTLACVAGSLLIANERVRALALGLAVALVLWVSAAAVLLLYSFPGGSNKLARRQT